MHINKFIEEIKVLEARNLINREVTLLKNSLIPSTLGLD